MIVRGATVADAPAIGEVHVASWRRAYRGLMPDALLDGLDPVERAAAWRKRIAGGVTVLVAEIEGLVRGFAALGPIRDPDLLGTTELYALYLAPPVWRRGLGRTLLAAAVAGQGPVALWVLAENQRARRFYEATGFVADGAARRKDFGGRAVEEVRYMFRPPSTSMVRPLK